ncbi:hypothetical protein SKAU_G00347210 [Synaphobranchus kaupii]|uniref:Uncharacterized protein n=1 Tax=Synaphobranchus kaupii TaxID=118154 RepID=A0A9Q1EJR8_SYNKA|nr:hypothetical protein SKAU_G00347210 [Synaphobranchus kaupii]
MTSLGSVESGRCVPLSSPRFVNRALRERPPLASLFENALRQSDARLGASWPERVCHRSSPCPHIASQIMSVAITRFISQNGRTCCSRLRVEPPLLSEWPLVRIIPTSLSQSRTSQSFIFSTRFLSYLPETPHSDKYR